MRTTFLILTVLFSLHCSAQSTEEKSVLSTVDHFFSAMTARDTAAMSATLVRSGSLFIASLSGDAPVRSVSFQTYLNKLAQGKERFVERYWKSEVTFHNASIATASMEYDFHVDGTFSHCGTDVFELVKGPEGWLISSVSFTMMTEGCVPSPLGPIEEGTGNGRK
ncbi:MAG TPA: nuclear transport factor 2 family protein [Flavobacteriales bacterium]|nr:nuclear transport factor 2 family protein [Flavobacteriales bacterium]